MADFDYRLPEAAIAQVPVEPRDAARLLVAVGGAPAHRRVSDLADLLHAGDLLVVNTTRVLPARLHLRKATGGAAEVLLLEPCGPGPDDWEALVRPGRRLPPGSVLASLTGEPLVAVGAPSADGAVRRVRLLGDPWACGEVPLPPYLHQGIADPERYQTVYADRPGSVAAPTAGLHLTTAVIERCRAKGVGFATVDLAVGLDTFRPVTVADPADHQMHTEAYRISEQTWTACEEARAAGGRVVAVGTTTVRALEAATETGRLEGRTALFIRPPRRVRSVDVLMTNFHLPRSSLLLLVEAFAGPGWRELYRLALEDGYRFLSFGDAMLLGNCGERGA
jgi:S-adenosylmethionine:tRNA ribosyltransferase-isomerase